MSRALIVEEPGTFRVVEVETPVPGPAEALIRVAAGGLCGSDRELFEGSRPAEFVAYPVTPGHEWSGTVEAVGAGTDPGLVGAAVVGEGYRGCQVCARCREGSPNLCAAGYDETGFTRPGAFAEHLVVPARLLHVLSLSQDGTTGGTSDGSPAGSPDDGAALRAAALLEPAAVVASALRLVAPRPGETVAVVGAGTLGMLTVQYLAAASPARLVAVDPRTERAEAVLAAGATAVYRPGEAPEGAFDLVVETAGAAGTARAAVALARRGGRVVITGIPGDPGDSVPTSLLVTRALTLHTVFGSRPADWSYAVRAFTTGVLRPAALVTHELPLTDFAAALKLSASPDAGKVLLRPDLD